MAERTKSLANGLHGAGASNGAGPSNGKRARSEANGLALDAEPARTGPFRFTNAVKEDHSRPLYGMAFNFCDLRHRDVLATAGANRVTVYDCGRPGSLSPLQCYVDADADESFFCLAWSSDEATGAPLVVAAGLKGVVRVLDCNTGSLRQSVIGHGNAVNDLKVHPHRPSLVLTCSKDESLRLWNVRTGVCVLILAGDGGHRNEVLYVDIHPRDPHRLLSSGMDNTIKIWHTHDLQPTVAASHEWPLGGGGPRPFPTKHLQQPYFSTYAVHGCYVDCARWCGDLVLSKSTENKIVLWKPHKEGAYGRPVALPLREFGLDNCTLWFQRFALDFRGGALALGDRRGRVHVWNAREDPPGAAEVLIVDWSQWPGCAGGVAAAAGTGAVEAGHMELVIRQTAVSFGGGTVLAACDDGSLLRWDRQPRGGGRAKS